MIKQECLEDMRELMAQFLVDIVKVADKHNVDRDELVERVTKLLVAAASVSTFKRYDDYAVAESAKEENQDE